MQRQPDSDPVLDVVVHSPSWLEPAEMHALVAAEHPEARLAVEGEEWLAPAEEVHDPYAVVLDIGPGGRDGVVEVLVHPDTEPEPAIADRDWADDAIAYWIRWTPSPSVPNDRTDSRRRAAAMVQGIARALVDATGGVAVDADGTVLDPYSV